MSKVVFASALVAATPLPEPWPDVVNAYLTETHLRGGRSAPRSSTAEHRTGASLCSESGLGATDRSPLLRLRSKSWYWLDERLPRSACGWRPSPACTTSPGASGAIGRNPAESVRRPRPAAGVLRGLAIDELRRLLAVVPSSRSGRRDRAIILLMLLSGLRRSEVFGLRVSDIDFATGDYAVPREGRPRRPPADPPPALAAIVDALEAEGRQPRTGCETPLFAISDAGFYASLRRYGALANLEAVSPTCPSPFCCAASCWRGIHRGRVLAARARQHRDDSALSSATGARARRRLVGRGQCLGHRRAGRRMMNALAARAMSGMRLEDRPLGRRHVLEGPPA